MLKLDKNTHLMIIVTFSLIFIVVYLYYTITDVRNMQKTIKKLTDDLVIVSQKVHTLEDKCVQSFSKQQACNPAPKQDTLKDNGKKGNVVSVTQVVVNETLPIDTTYVSCEDEDDQSVLTSEVREVLECTDDEEDGVVGDVPVDSSVDENVDAINILDIINNKDNNTANDQETIQVINEELHVELVEKAAVSIEDVQKMKYDELRELSRKLNVNQKGTKDILVKRLSEFLASQ